MGVALAACLALSLPIAGEAPRLRARCPVQSPAPSIPDLPTVAVTPPPRPRRRA